MVSIHDKVYKEQFGAVKKCDFNIINQIAQFTFKVKLFSIKLCC